jgi:hypothetical protein
MKHAKVLCSAVVGGGVETILIFLDVMREVCCVHDPHAVDMPSVYPPHEKK